MCAGSSQSVGSFGAASGISGGEEGCDQYHHLHSQVSLNSRVQLFWGGVGGAALWWSAVSFDDGCCIFMAELLWYIIFFQTSVVFFSISRHSSVNLGATGVIFKERNAQNWIWVLPMALKQRFVFKQICEFLSKLIFQNLIPLCSFSFPFQCVCDLYSAWNTGQPCSWLFNKTLIKVTLHTHNRKHLGKKVSCLFYSHVW